MPEQKNARSEDAEDDEEDRVARLACWTSNLSTCSDCAGDGVGAGRGCRSGCWSNGVILLDKCVHVYGGDWRRALVGRWGIPQILVGGI